VVRLGEVAPRQAIEVAHLGQVAAAVRPGDGLLLASGWSRHVDDPALYRDRLPPVSEELARWCVEKRVKLLGVEPPSVADVNDRDRLTRIHTILLGGGVTIVEGLAHLETLARPRVFFIALPLKIHDGDGCPCRAMAFEGDEDAPCVTLPL
jgi:kynurenine formamidase